MRTHRKFIVLVFTILGLITSGWSTTAHARFPEQNESLISFSIDSSNATLTDRRCEIEGENCHIVGIGAIDSNASNRLEEFLTTNRVRSGTIFFDSDGGTVSAGIRLGYAIRSFGLNTSIYSYATNSISNDPQNISIITSTDAQNSISNCVQPNISKSALRINKFGNYLTKEQREYNHSIAIYNRCLFINISILERQFEDQLTRLNGQILDDSLLRHGSCVSACAIAFMGGVQRSFPGSSELFRPRDFNTSRISEIVTSVTGLGRDIQGANKQEYIGFHLFTPGDDVDGPPAVELALGVEMGQLESTSLVAFLTDMGFKSPADIMSFFTRTGRQGIIGSRPFYMPSNEELSSSGIIDVGGFGDWGLEAIDGSLMYVSRYSNNNVWQKQLSLFCATMPERRQVLALGLSGTNEIMPTSTGGQFFSMVGLGEAPVLAQPLSSLMERNIPLQSRLFSQRTQWSFRISLNGSVEQESGQIATEFGPSSECGDSSSNKSSVLYGLSCPRYRFIENEGWHFSENNSKDEELQSFDHFVIPLDGHWQAQLVAGSTLLIEFRTDSNESDNYRHVISTLIDDQFINNINILSSACFSISEPADKLDEFQVIRF